MAKKLISYDDTKPGLGLPDVVEGEMRRSFAPVDAPLAPKRKFMPGLDPRATKLILAPHEGHGWSMVQADDGGSTVEDTSRPGPFSDRSIRIARLTGNTELMINRGQSVNLDDGPLVVWVHMPFQNPGGVTIMLGNSLADRWEWSMSSVAEESASSPHVDGWTAYELYPEDGAKIGNPLRHGLSHVRVRSSGTNYELWVGAIAQRISPQISPRQVTSQPVRVGDSEATMDTGVTLDETIRSPMGTGSYRLEYAAGSTGLVLTGLNLGSLEEIRDQETVAWVKFDEGMAQPQALQVELYDDSISNRYQAYIYADDPGGVSYRYPGWVGVRLHSKLNFGTIGTPPDQVTSMRIQALTANGSKAAYFGGVEIMSPPVPLYPRGVLTIFFDDGYLDTYTKASKVLGRYGMSATVAAIAAYPNENPVFATIEQLRELQDRAGWEVAGHSWSPNDNQYRFTNLTPEALEAEFRNMKTWLVSHGFDSDTWVSPGGQSSRAVWEVGRRYFSVHRGVGVTMKHGAYKKSPRCAYPAFINSPNFSATGTPLQMLKDVVDATVAGRTWGTVTFHQVIDGPSSGQQISVDDLDDFCAHVAASGVAVRTVKQIMEEAN